MSIRYTIQPFFDAIVRALGQRVKHDDYTDLDHLIDTWEEAPGFDHAIADFERVDEDAWK